MTIRERNKNNLLQKYKDKVTIIKNYRHCYICLKKVDILPNLKTLRCNNYKCKKTQKIFYSKTINESHLKIEETLLIIDLLLQGSSNKVIKTITGVNKSTVLSIKKNLKTELRKMFWNSSKPIGGAYNIVKTDESKFGKRKYHRGHHLDGVWVLVIVERSAERKIKYFMIKKRDKITINAIFKKHVKIGSIVYSDMWKGYNDLNLHGYNHLTVNHSQNFVNPLTLVHTNTIEGNWSSAKAFIKKRFRNKKYIGLYLVIMMIKRNFSIEPIDFYLNNLK